MVTLPEEEEPLEKGEEASLEKGQALKKDIAIAAKLPLQKGKAADEISADSHGAALVKGHEPLQKEAALDKGHESTLTEGVPCKRMEAALDEGRESILAKGVPCKWMKMEAALGKGCDLEKGYPWKRVLHQDLEKGFC